MLSYVYQALPMDGRRVERGELGRVRNTVTGALGRRPAAASAAAWAAASAAAVAASAKYFNTTSSMSVTRDSHSVGPIIFMYMPSIIGRAGSGLGFVPVRLGGLGSALCAHDDATASLSDSEASESAYAAAAS